MRRQSARTPPGFPPFNAVRPGGRMRPATCGSPPATPTSFNAVHPGGRMRRGHFLRGSPGTTPSMRSAPEGGCDDRAPRTGPPPCPSMRSAPEGGCDVAVAFNCGSRSLLQCGPPRRADATPHPERRMVEREPSMRSAPEGGCDDAMASRSCARAILPSMRSAPEGGCDPSACCITHDTHAFLPSFLQCGPPRRADATGWLRAAGGGRVPSFNAVRPGGRMRQHQPRLRPRSGRPPSMRSAPEGGCDGATTRISARCSSFNAVRPGGRMRRCKSSSSRARTTTFNAVRPGGRMRHAGQVWLQRADQPSMRSAPEGGCDVW